MKVKVCGLTLYEDVIFCIKNKINFIGFNFYKESKRYIDPDNVKSILNKIKSNSNDYNMTNTFSVGVFVNSSVHDIVNIAEYLSLDFVQLHSDEDILFCNELKKSNIKIIKVFRVNEKSDLLGIHKFNECSDFFLFDKKSSKEYGGTGETINPEIFINHNINKDFFLAGGLSLENIKSLTNAVKPFAIDVNSKFEISPGKKDLNKLKKLDLLLQ